MGEEDATRREGGVSVEGGNGKNERGARCPTQRSCSGGARESDAAAALLACIGRAGQTAGAGLRGGAPYFGRRKGNGGAGRGMQKPSGTGGGGGD